MKIQFTAVLQGANTIKVDDDNAGVMRLTFDGSQFPQVVQLSMYQRQPLTVTVETETGVTRKKS
jgi:hypothetical protein